MVPMYTCCFASYGLNDDNVEALSFTVTRIGDKSNEVVHRDWIWRINPITGEEAEEKDLDAFLDKNIKFLSKNYKDTAVSMLETTVPLEKCVKCNCGQYLYRNITYENFMEAQKHV
jgi:hypothetical protein